MRFPCSFAMISTLFFWKTPTQEYMVPHAPEELGPSCVHSFTHSLTHSLAPVPYPLRSTRSSGCAPHSLTHSLAQGCDISCDKCDGRTGQVVHPKYVWNGTGDPPSWSDPTHQILPDPRRPNPIDHGARVDDPTSSRLSICKEPKHRATICDPKLRTLNVNAECHSAEDVFQFAPWRAPGAAPVHDACGVAGGVLPGQGPASAGGDYQPTVHAARGDIGSKLPPRPTGTVWRTGEEVEVAWVQKAWHGGGYQYRLCPADSALTEECFQSHAVPFADGTSMLRWGGQGGEELRFNATDVSVGTLPAGSTWRRGPFPRGPWEWYNWAASYEPVCDEPPACRNAHTRPHVDPSTHDRSEGTFPCKCSGSGDGDLYHVEIVDKLRLPADLKAGEWVLGWRWDCEESTQVRQLGEGRVVCSQGCARTGNLQVLEYGFAAAGTVGITAAAGATAAAGKLAMLLLSHTLRWWG